MLRDSQEALHAEQVPIGRFMSYNIRLLLTLPTVDTLPETNMAIVVRDNRIKNDRDKAIFGQRVYSALLVTCFCRILYIYTNEARRKGILTPPEKS